MDEVKMKFKISLLDNGVHSFNKGLDEFISYEKDAQKDDFKLKEAIMFFHHGVELLLKQVLIEQRGEYLIFDNIGSETVKKIISAKQKGISVFNLDKPVHTTNYLDVIQRIKAFIDSPELDESLETRLIELNTIRNNIEHYGIDTEKTKVENLLLNLKEPISKFFKNAGLPLGGENQNKWAELEKQLLIEASRLRGAGSIKKAELRNNTAYIEYVQDFEDYKNLQSQSSVTEALFESYWSTGAAVLKAINDGGVRLMRKIELLNKVSIKIPFKDDIYTIELIRKDVEAFVGYKFDDIRKNWDDTFSNKYVYSKVGREEFFRKFGKIEKKRTHNKN